MTDAADDIRRIVVVGGGIAGGRTCIHLREAGYDGDIVLVAAEEHRPYDRPPLSKGYLDRGDDPDLALDLDGAGVELVNPVRATSLDRQKRLVGTDAGDYSYDRLVIATGVEPRRLLGDGPQVTLRRKEDADTLRSRLVPGSRLVIVGAGWIGAEVATTALERGCDVLCLEGGPGPLAGPLGPEVAERFAELWDRVDLRTGQAVARVVANGVELADGTVVEGDTVLTCVGAVPDLGWLTEAGLETDRQGLVVDNQRRTNDPSIYAVGDIASRWNEVIGQRLHTGHWDEAANGAKVVADAIMGRESEPDEVPYFWSDQFGVKIQYVGQHQSTDRVVLRDHEDPHRWGAAWLDDNDRLTAHLSVSFPKSMVQARRAIFAGSVVDSVNLASLSQKI